MSLLADLFVTSHTLDSGEPSQPSPELEKCFFDRLRLRNGVYKTTYAHRMDDLNARVADYLPVARPLRMLDVAISSGVSTLEWVEALEETKLDYHMTGIDLTIRGFLVSFGDRLHAVVDRTKWPMLLEIDGEWLSNPPRKRHVLRYAFSLAVIKSALRLWAHQYHESKAERPERILGMPTRTRAINLVTPRLVNHPRVTISERDILAEGMPQNTFHVIRAANILNKDYFDDGMLTRLLHNLRRQLTRGGILVVCHTDDDGLNRATIFKLCQDNRFVALSRMNGGSEIEDLILQLPGQPAN
jgi:hypothetical protein